MSNLFIRLGNYIRERRNFLNFSVVGFGTIASVLALLTFGSYGGWVLWVSLVIASYAGGYLWGVVFWAVFLKNVFHQK